jgi:hypothetical protein
VLEVSFVVHSALSASRGSPHPLSNPLSLRFLPVCCPYGHPQLVTPSLLSGSLSLTDFASACAEGRGLSAVSLAQAIVAVRAANAEAPEVTSPGVASALFACVAPGRYSPVVNALGASAALFPALPAVAASRQALQRHSDVEALLALHAGVDPAVSRTADYAKLVSALLALGAQPLVGVCGSRTRTKMVVFA